MPVTAGHLSPALARPTQPSRSGDAEALLSSDSPSSPWPLNTLPPASPLIPATSSPELSPRALATVTAAPWAPCLPAAGASATWGQGSPRLRRPGPSPYRAVPQLSQGTLVPEPGQAAARPALPTSGACPGAGLLSWVLCSSGVQAVTAPSPPCPRAESPRSRPRSPEVRKSLEGRPRDKAQLWRVPCGHPGM